MAASFEETTAVRALEPGRYVARPDEAWAGPFGANGGILAAMILRAGEASLARPDLSPRALSVHFAASTRSGTDVHLLAETARAGRRTAVVSVDIHQAERLTAKGLVTFAAPAPGAATDLGLHAPAPDVPPPDQLSELDTTALQRPPAPPSLDRVRMWPALGAPIFSGAEQAVNGGWIAFRDDPTHQLVDAARLTALCDLWWPALFTATTTFVGVPTLAYSVHLRATAPVRAPVLARYETRTLAEGHLDVSAAIWSAERVLLAESHQIAQLTTS